jgi:hypothetical protein
MSQEEIQIAKGINKITQHSGTRERKQSTGRLQQGKGRAGAGGGLRKKRAREV